MRVVLKLEPIGADAGSAATVALSNSLGTPTAFSSALDIPEEEDPATLVLHVCEYHVRHGETAAQLDDAVDDADRLAHQAIAASFTRATDLYNEGKLEDARGAFERAELLLRGDVGPRRVLVLLSLAEIEREKGELESAVRWLDRALAIAPTHRGALETRIAIAQEKGEASLAATLLERLVTRLETSDKKVDVFRAIADDSLQAARTAIEQASALVPGDLQLLERLRAVNEAAGQWGDAVSALVQIAEHTPLPRDRAKVLVDAARLCSERARQTSRAVALYEAAIEDDPHVPGAFEAIEAELVQAADAGGLAAAYIRQIARLSGAGDVEEQPALLRRLANVQRQALADASAAMATLQRLLVYQPFDVPALLELAELQEANGNRAEAIRLLESVVTIDPSRVDVFRWLLRLFTASGDSDRTYCACSALVAMGEADLDEQLLFAQHRPEALPIAKSKLNDETWTHLLPAGHLHILDELSVAIESVAFDAWYGLDAKSIPPVGEKVNPQKTTVSAARCFTWAAQLLGLPEPDIYLQPSQMRIGMRMLPVRKLSIELGHSVLSGWGMSELAFLAAHHLTYARPGWRIITLLGSRDDIRSLMMAGMSVARPDVPGLAEVGSRASEFAQQLGGHMSSGAKEIVGALVEKVVGSGGPLDVFAWLRCVEETAGRAGLLASGNLTVASNVLAITGASPGGQSAAERARGLLAFCVSQQHSEMRKTLGVAVIE